MMKFKRAYNKTKNTHSEYEFRHTESAPVLKALCL